MCSFFITLLPSVNHYIHHHHWSVLMRPCWDSEEGAPSKYIFHQSQIDTVPRPGRSVITMPTMSVIYKFTLAKKVVQLNNNSGARVVGDLKKTIYGSGSNVTCEIFHLL